MEAYPELKSDRPLIEAQQTWTEIEAQITAARRFYNAAVNQLNNAIQIFPGQLIAAVAGVKSMPFFEAPAAARTAPSVDAILGPQAVTHPAVDTALLERRRRLACRASAITLLAALIAGRSAWRSAARSRATRIGGAFLMAAIVGADRLPLDRPRAGRASCAGGC